MELIGHDQAVSLVTSGHETPGTESSQHRSFPQLWWYSLFLLTLLWRQSTSWHQTENSKQLLSLIHLLTYNLLAWDAQLHTNYLPACVRFCTILLEPATIIIDKTFFTSSALTKIGMLLLKLFFSNVYLFNGLTPLPSRLIFSVSWLIPNCSTRHQ